MAYSETYFTQRESWRDWRSEARELLRWARVTRTARVLEIGCGGGGLLRMLHARGARAVGVDTLDAALVLAHERLQINKATRRGDQKNNFTVSHSPLVSLAQVGEDGALPFHASAFDALIAQHVIEHLPNVAVALDEWRRVLRVGGHLALVTPNARYPDPAHFADADHARIFSPDELRAAVTRAGFGVEACFTIFPYLGRLRALRAFGVLAYRAFQHAPYFAARGRTIVLGARK